MSGQQQGQGHGQGHGQGGGGLGGKPFDLDAELTKVEQEPDFETRLNRLWDLCQQHLDHDLDRARAPQVTKDMVINGLRDGMAQWSRWRSRIIQTINQGSQSA